MARCIEQSKNLNRVEFYLTLWARSMRSNQHAKDLGFQTTDFLKISRSLNFDDLIEQHESTQVLAVQAILDDLDQKDKNVIEHIYLDTKYFGNPDNLERDYVDLINKIEPKFTSKNLF